MTTAGEIRAIPPGSLLLHVGTRKSGTTAIQSAFAEARGELEDRQVIYPGDQLNQARELKMIRSGKRVPPGFMKEAQRSGFRVLLSAEVLDNTAGDQVDRLVTALDHSGLHVLITARPLASVLPSQWQQNIKTGRTNKTMLRWLEGSLARRPKPSYMRPDLMAKEWCRVLEGERIHVVLHGASPDLMKVMAALMDLPASLLKPGLSNRGLTVEEAELVRRVRTSGLAFQDEAIKVPPAVKQLVEQRRPAAWENRPRIPITFLNDILELQRTVVSGLSQLPVNIVGDLEAWGDVDRTDFASEEMQLDDLDTGAHSVPTDALDIVLRSLAQDPHQ